MLKLPWLSSSSCNAASWDNSNPKAIIKNKNCCRLLGASFSPSGGITISTRRRTHEAISCEAAAADSSSSAGSVLEKSVADRLRQGSLAADGLSYNEKFVVRCYEVGINKTATVDTIANLLQEVAINHSQSLGFSTDGFGTTTSMRKLHLIWVVADMHIEIYKYPAWGNVVEIESWFESKGRSGTRRDWILKDYATHEVLGKATSKLVMINQDTRKYAKVSYDAEKEYSGFTPREPRLAFSERVKKIAQLEDPAQYYRRGLVPRGGDMDMNMHVNNVVYIRWILESMPQEIIETHELETISLQYKHECQQDDVVDCHTSPEPFEVTKVSELNGSIGTAAAAAAKGKEGYCQFLHSLRLSRDGIEISKARTEWRKKPTRHANHSA